MSQEKLLLAYVLHDQLQEIDDVTSHLEAALELEVDPLDYCSNRFDLGEREVMERAAAWAGLAFAPGIPHTLPGGSIIQRIDTLGEIRTVRAMLFDREIVYSAPRFMQFVKLREQVERDPSFSRHLCVVPASAIRAQLAEDYQSSLLDEARQRLVRRWPRSTGGLDLSKWSRLAFVIGVAGLLLAACMAPVFAQPVSVPLLGAVLLLPSVLRLWAAIAPQPAPGVVPLLTDSELPVYSILLPLRDEAAMVGQLSGALRAIDYPPEKLDIRFVVEAQSIATVAAAVAELWDPRFELVVVPDANPRTKPKALNYALPLVRGTFLVVYDAEDIPDPAQLRLAASTFAVRPDLDCLQAELTIDNARESLVTALFAGEYAGQFGLMLPLLARLRFPMPLGGTSNHFRLSALRRVGGWDPFNVTEDADLGLRLARLGLKTETINSQTREEAPVSVGAWLKQRTRWMKGWMQTFIVHNRNPLELRRELGWRGFLGFHIYVGSMILSAPLHSIFVISSIVAGFMPHRTATFTAWDLATATVIFVGYGGPAALVVAGLARLERRDLLVQQLLLPVYWLLHSVAAVRALWELLTRPYFWAKTEHGRTRAKRSGAIARHPEVADIDLRRPARDNIGEHPAGAGSHGPAERAVSGVEIEV
jgi:glycosyltransferase XagB